MRGDGTTAQPSEENHTANGFVEDDMVYIDDVEFCERLWIFGTFICVDQNLKFVNVTKFVDTFK